MIQTQLLRLDPPYQIISARGQVGIQIATLIVVEDPIVKFHSFPVVCYGLKQGLEEEMKYNNNPFDYEANYAIHRRLKPEGAVWSGVEVKDVQVLGLAGANNDPIGLDLFVGLIPTAWGIDPNLYVWDNTSTSRLYELYTGLGNVGMRTQKLQDDRVTREGTFPISLMLEPTPALDGYFVKVIIREDIYDDISARPDDNIFFRCLVNPSKSDSINECAATISEALNVIASFLPKRNISFSWHQRLRQGDMDYSEVMEQLVTLVKDNFKGYFIL